jgi:hypothetical protein
MTIGNTPGDLGIMAAREDNRRAARNQPRMWLVTWPTAVSEMADVCWECDWIELGHAFKGGLEGAEVCDLYHSEQQARNVAQSLLDVRDGKLDPGMVRE